jgi:hypothetical protein
MTTSRAIKWMRIAACFLGVLALGIASFYLIENHRGKAAWADTHAWLESKGESLDPSTYSPAPVPDDQNFWGTPTLLDLVPKDETARNDPARAAKAKRLKEIDIVNVDEESKNNPMEIPTWANMSRNKRYNLAVWAAYYAASKNYASILRGNSDAEKILSAFQPYDRELKELALASDRPFSQIPRKHDPAKILVEPLEYLSPTLMLSKALGLRIYAAAVARDDQTFRDSIRIINRLAEGLYRDPLVISQLVAVTCQDFLVQSVWQCLEERLLSAQELAWLEAELSTINVLPPARNAIAFETLLVSPASYDVFASSNPDRLRAFRNITGVEETFSFSNLGTTLRQTAFILAPSGWFEQQKKNTVLPFYTGVLVPFRTETIGPQIPILDKADTLPQKEARKGSWFDPLPDFQSSLGTVSWIIKLFQAENTLRQARIACALERYYLDHHSYPSDLQPLVPAYLKEIPKDLIDGAPMRYRTTPQGRYLIYSIGWNQVDDGGLVPDLHELQSRSDRAAEGDWVWSYPPPAVRAAAKD